MCLLLNTGGIAETDWRGTRIHEEMEGVREREIMRSCCLLLRSGKSDTFQMQVREKINYRLYTSRRTLA